MLLQEFWLKFQAMRTKSKPFTKTEMKILVFNKMKQGHSYYKAKEIVAREVRTLLENAKKGVKTQRTLKRKKKGEDKKHLNFKSAFQELINED